MLSDAQIDAATLSQWGEMKGQPLAAHRAYARAIEAEVRKQDEALIQQLTEAAALPSMKTGAMLRQRDMAIEAARARLEGKP